MRRSALQFSVALLVASLVLGGCKGGTRESGNTFKIGVITSLIGNQAAFGQAHKNGYTVALTRASPRRLTTSVAKAAPASPAAITAPIFRAEYSARAR